ncbi:MAG: hypothetical protein IT367_13865 [Candidatus Hydrogenedentes bacterium]|nr:hypothetical protein [Candidatus Hydrogenedentota bacterium]
MLSTNRLPAIRDPFTVHRIGQDVAVEYIDDNGETWIWNGRPVAVMVWIGRAANRGWITWAVHNELVNAVWGKCK